MTLEIHSHRKELFSLKFVLHTINSLTISEGSSSESESLFKYLTAAIKSYTNAVTTQMEGLKDSIRTL